MISQRTYSSCYAGYLAMLMWSIKPTSTYTHILVLMSDTNVGRMGWGHQFPWLSLPADQWHAYYAHTQKKTTTAALIRQSTEKTSMLVSHKIKVHQV